MGASPAGLGVIVIREAKEGDLKPKYATLWPEEIDVIQSLPRCVPLTPCFVHPPGTPGVPAGTPMHVRLLNLWVKRAVKSMAWIQGQRSIQSPGTAP